MNPKRNKNSNNLGKSSRLLVETEILKNGKINAIQRKMHKLTPKKQIKLFLPITDFIFHPKQSAASEKANPEHREKNISGTTIIASINIHERGAYKV